MEASIVKLTFGERIPQQFFRAWFEEVVLCLKKEKTLKNKNRLKALELTCVFVDKPKIQELNKNYRRKNKVTDVLSFDGDGVISLGELIFCLDVIKVKAKDHKLPLKCYLSMLMTHGLLHLLGYEHEEGGALEVEMFRLQNKIMRKVAAKLAPNYKTSFDVV